MIKLTERNRNIAAAIVLILVLGGVSFWQRRSREQENPPVKHVVNNQINSGDVQTDVEASEQIMEQLIPQVNVETDFKKSFDTEQNISGPEIKDKDLKIVDNKQQNIVAYFSDLGKLIDSYSNDVGDIYDRLFNEDISANEINLASTRTQKLVKDLYATQVPKDAVVLHKSIIALYLANTNYMSDAKSYQNDKESDQVWKNVYHDYVVSQAAIITMQNNYKALKGKYKIQ